MNEYWMVFQNGSGFVYADSYYIFSFSFGKVAQFYRNERICYTRFDVISVELVP